MPTLKITRRAGDAVQVFGPCVIEIAAARGGKVRLGIEAPAAVPIVRAELAAAPPPPVGVIIERARAPQAWRDVFGDVASGNVLVMLPPELVGAIPDAAGYVAHRRLDDRGGRLYLVLIDAPGVVPTGTGQAIDAARR